MADEPVPGQRGGSGEGAWLLKQVSGARHDGKLVLAAQLGLGAAVEVQYHVVIPADDQQRRRGHRRQPRAGEIGPATAGHHGRDAGIGLGCRP